MPTTHHAAVNIESSSSVRADAKVIRRPQSWTFIYIVLGFVVAVELAIIPLLAQFPWNAIACIAMVAFTVYLFLFNGWFQNWLIGIKNWYEGTARQETVYLERMFAVAVRDGDDLFLWIRLRRAARTDIYYMLPTDVYDYIPPGK